MYWNMEIFESPYFNTWRFKNIHVLKHGGFVRQTVHIFQSLVSIHGDSKISVNKKQNFLNLHVSIHRDSKISMYWNTEIQKFSCFIHGDLFLKRPITQWNRNRWCKYFKEWIRGLYDRTSNDWATNDWTTNDWTTNDWTTNDWTTNMNN